MINGVAPSTSSYYTSPYASAVSREAQPVEAAPLPEEFPVEEPSFVPRPVIEASASERDGLYMRLQYDPVAMTVPGRIQHEPKEAFGSELPGAKGLPGSPEEESCKTCSERTYMDGSNDSSVSFQTPTHIDPDQAASAVRSHEQEHVINETINAKLEGREVVSQSVAIHTDVCPECGKAYVSGGTTSTVTRAAHKHEHPEPEAKPQPAKEPKAA